MARTKRKKALGFSAPKKLVVPNYDHIDQKVAKSFMPKGGYIWRVRQIDGWSSRFKEEPSKGFKEADFDGPKACLIAALRHAWEQCLDDNGLDKSDCPVQGLFESD